MTLPKGRKKQDPVARLMGYVEKDPTGCWVWNGTKDRDGYGKTRVDGKMKYAHRAMYELLVGPIEEGATLDHLCHTEDLSCLGGRSCPHRLCVNPEHLEPVSALENGRRGDRNNVLRRRTHCRNGHPFNDENTYFDKNGHRRCRACRRVGRKVVTECLRGHPYTEENTYWNQGKRSCMTCRKEFGRKRRPKATKEETR